MLPTSPFLHRDAEDRKHQIRYVGNARRERMERDKFMANWTLETLRYKQWVRNGKVGAVMQGIGNFGRSRSGSFFGGVVIFYALWRIARWW